MLALRIVVAAARLRGLVGLRRPRPRPPRAPPARRPLRPDRDADRPARPARRRRRRPPRRGGTPARPGRRARSAGPPLARRLIAGSLDRSVDVAATLELRGYGARHPRRGCRATGASPARSPLLASRRSPRSRCCWPPRLTGDRRLRRLPADRDRRRARRPLAARAGAPRCSPSLRSCPPPLERAAWRSRVAEPALEISSLRVPLRRALRRPALDRLDLGSRRGSSSSSPAARAPARARCCAPRAASSRTSTAARSRARSRSAAARPASTARPSSPRHVGFVAQEPETQVVSTTVRAELELPLELRGAGPVETARAVEEAALALGIEPLLERTTDSLSGGELQRVALGAALVTGPAAAAPRRADLAARPGRRRRADLAAAAAERGVGGDRRRSASTASSAASPPPTGCSRSSAGELDLRRLRRGLRPRSRSRGRPRWRRRRPASSRSPASPAARSASRRRAPPSATSRRIRRRGLRPR